MLFAVVIGIVALALLGQYVGSDTGASPTASQPSVSEGVGSLPQEAIETIALIQSDGPFSYRQDGAVFMNRERRLPAHERGYWREYTVPTPGESDRGARRIVHGAGDEYYYTDDHYGSFTRVHPPKLAK